MRQPVRDWKEFGEIPVPNEALKDGDLQKALGGFAISHLLDYRYDRMRIYSDGDVCGFGVVLWLLGDTFGAASVWSRACEEALKGRYTYSSMGTFQSGLLLWFASVWLKDGDWHSEAEALFEKLLRRRRPAMEAGYPGQLARLLRGDVEISEVQTRQSDVALLRERQQTQALFYAGVRAFEDGRVQETERLWRQVKEPENSLVELEYYLLKHERDLLQNRA